MKAPNIHRFLAFAALFSAQATYVNAASDSWNVNAAGNWVDSGNWLGGNVPGAGDTATFGNVVLTANRTVTVDSNRAISGIVFNNTNTGAFGYTLNGGNFLLGNAGTISVEGVTTGNKTENVNSAIQFQGATALFSNTSSGATHTLNIAGNLTTAATATTLTLHATNSSTNLLQGTISGNIGVVKTGAGTWSIRFGNNNFNGGLEVQAGTIDLYNSITAGGSGTITLNGGNLSFTKNINNNSTFETNSYANAVSVLQNARIDTFRQNSGGGSGKNQSVSSLSVASGVTLTRRGWDGYGLAVANATTIGGNVSFVNNAYGATTAGQRPTASNSTTSQVASGATLLLNTLTVADSAATSSVSVATFDGSQSLDNSYISGAITDNANDATKRLGITKSGTNVLTLAGTNTYTGATTVSAGTLLLSGQLGNTNTTIASGATFNMGIGSTYNIVIGANGVNTMIDGLGTANFEGGFTFDLTGASIANNNAWQIVDVGNLTENFTSNFGVSGFTESSNVWTKVEGNNTWSFDESTGQLALAVIPEPRAALLGGLGLLALIRRKR
ncbi:MAG: autotransporter-associated beta strand repeat-containing protein [Verrucomicrobiae bacterium]|nr:autotransporter-associated beta strand repeat-containing protein [Verrucomicrobiae bacterium]MCP5532303.1 autotransporter-associated beta strand repeat-containing protein [Akkermansiaceae bacterium]